MIEVSWFKKLPAMNEPKKTVSTCTINTLRESKLMLQMNAICNLLKSMLKDAQCNLGVLCCAVLCCGNELLHHQEIALRGLPDHKQSCDIHMYSYSDTLGKILT